MRVYQRVLVGVGIFIQLVPTFRFEHSWHTDHSHGSIAVGSGSPAAISAPAPLSGSRAPEVSPRRAPAAPSCPAAPEPAGSRPGCAGTCAASLGFAALLAGRRRRHLSTYLPKTLSRSIGSMSTPTSVLSHPASLRQSVGAWLRRDERQPLSPIDPNSGSLSPPSIVSYWSRDLK